MDKLELKLTVDDLIVEYMMYKVRNGYEPRFSASEFISFLRFFETKMHVDDVTHDKTTLFRGFFDRMTDRVWSSTNYSTNKKYANPHMNMDYSIKDNDYVISANYKLSDYDRSVIHTFFMDNGMSKYEDYKGTAWKIRQIIGEYLSDKPKRIIDESTEVSENDLLIGKYLAAEIISQMWSSYIDEQIERKKWPEQCRDINKYLFEMDLSTLIELKPIKNELLQLYSVLSKRIAILYQEDRNLKVSSREASYLAKANYMLLIKGYEKMMNSTFGTYKKSLEFDLSSSTFKESHEANGVYYWDDDPDVRTTITSIENEKVKTLVNNIEKGISK